MKSKNNSVPWITLSTRIHVASNIYDNRWSNYFNAIYIFLLYHSPIYPSIFLSSNFHFSPGRISFNSSVTSLCLIDVIGLVNFVESFHSTVHVYCVSIIFFHFYPITTSYRDQSWNVWSKTKKNTRIVFLYFSWRKGNAVARCLV